MSDMLESYLFPISYAFLSFPLAATLFTLPFLIVQYRKHGYINKYRGVMLYLLLLYLLNAVFLVLLPFPSTIHNEPPAAASYVQPVPFHFAADVLRETNASLDRPATYWYLLKERAVLQVLFNVLLTVPLGFFLRYVFQARPVTCLLAAFGLSLFFEITQVTGIYGIFDYPYRLFDADDLLTNTIGGLLGYAAAGRLTARLPRMDKLNEAVDLSKERVSWTRRALAFLLDWSLLLPALALLTGFKVPYGYGLLIAGYFIALPYATNGRTFGKWVVRIRLQGGAERISVRELVVRYGFLYFAAGGLNVTGNVHWSAWLLALVVVSYYFVLAVHLARCAADRRRTACHEELSGTSHVIS